MSRQHDAPRTRQLVRRGALNWSDRILLSVGVLVVLGAIVVMNNLIGQLVAATIGLLIVEAGLGRIFYRHLANQRKYLALRREIDHFLALTRQLNTAGLSLKQHEAPETRQAFEHVRQMMQESVERMAVVAGQTDAEVAIEAETYASMDCQATTTQGCESKL